MTDGGPLLNPKSRRHCLLYKLYAHTTIWKSTLVGRTDRVHVNDGREKEIEKRKTQTMQAEKDVRRDVC